MECHRVNSELSRKDGYQAQATDDSESANASDLRTKLSRNVSGPQPQMTPEGTIQTLFNDNGFFNKRYSHSTETIQYIRPTLTSSLKNHFDKSERDLADWMARPQNPAMPQRPPFPEGPLFTSNYEGASSFSVKPAVIKGDYAEVPVDLEYIEGTNRYRWTDTSILRRIDLKWYLDDIRFEEGGTLRKNTTVEYDGDSSVSE